MGQVDRLVVLGDSVTAGGLRAEDGSGCYVTLLGERFREAGVGVELIASALDGIDSDYALRRFKRMVSALDPDLVMVMLGLNDAQPAGARPRATPREFGKNLARIVERIFQIDAIPFLMTPNPRFECGSPSPAEGDLMPPYVDAVRDVARTYLIDCIDIHRRFRATAGFETLIPDGVHPNPPGHRLIADALAEELIPKIRNGETTSPAKPRKVRTQSTN